MDWGIFNALLNFLAVILSGGALAVVLTYRYRMRKLEVDKEASDRTADTLEIENLRTALRELEKHYRDMLKQADDRHAEADARHRLCQQRAEDMAEEVRVLRGEVAGLHRQIVELSTDRLVHLTEKGCPSDVAPYSVESIERVRKLISDDENEA